MYVYGCLGWELDANTAKCQRLVRSAVGCSISVMNYRRVSVVGASLYFIRMHSGHCLGAASVTCGGALASVRGTVACNTRRLSVHGAQEKNEHVPGQPYA